MHQFPEGGLAYKTSHVEDPVPETVAIRPPDFSVKVRKNLFSI